MNTNHFCVIMAGSSGNWFWPVSREQRPKEFLNLTGKPFLRETYDRFCQIVPKENILVVTLDKYKEGAKEILPDLADENLLIEPYGRHTCPCMAYAVYTILKRNPEAVIVSTPSDH
ncbi:MAG: mannose-1-phosphate guanylyltransferase, partial [Bacteroidales bacterium]|nr:mannose-1-phosphate guanylyltransferase [Bacteroidales bacterium]